MRAVGEIENKQNIKKDEDKNIIASEIVIFCRVKYFTEEFFQGYTLFAGSHFA